MQIVYHGTNVFFDTIDLSRAKASSDFGKGFYVTTSLQQAQIWSQEQARDFGGTPMVLKFKYLGHQGLNYRQFGNTITKEWLDFIVSNRRDLDFKHDFDIVFGLLADGSFHKTVDRYAEMSEEEKSDNWEELALLLKPYKYKDQLSFHTKSAIQRLRFVEVANE